MGSCSQQASRRLATPRNRAQHSWLPFYLSIISIDYSDIFLNVVDLHYHGFLLCLMLLNFCGNACFVAID
jgi:hypothetical protein